MGEHIIPLHDLRRAPSRPAGPVPAWDGRPPVDRLGRPLRDLRISVTDRCN